MRFPVVIHKDEASEYGVTVPDLPGCFSAGDSIEEAILSCREAVACHLEGLLLDGDAIPDRAPIETHQGRDEYGSGIWALIEVDVSKLSSRARRVNITVPERVLAIVDKMAAREGESRSAFLAQAALSYANRQSSR